MRIRITAVAALTIVGALGAAEPGGARSPGGSAQVRVGSGEYFAPITGRKIDVTVAGRFRGKGKLERKVWLRYQDDTSHVCARSYRRDKGRAIRLRLTRLEDGEFRATARHTWADPVAREEYAARFCVWLTRKSRSKAKPITQDVAFSTKLAGAAVSPSGAFWVAAHPNLTTLNWGAASTDPFTYTMVTTHRPVSGSPFCLDPRTDTQDVNQPSAASGLYTTSGFGPVGTARDDNPGPCVDDRSWSIDFRPEQAALAYTHDERVSGARPVKAAGDCYLGAAAFMSVREAEAYIELVGCVRGRVITRRTQPDRFGTPHPDEVYRFERYGAPVLLAPHGTRIDIVVQAR